MSLMAQDCAGYLEVERCVRCLDGPLRYLTGHVTLGPHIVLAGWCDACWVALRMDRQKSVAELRSVPGRGWCGHWVPAMGVHIIASPNARAVAVAAEHADRDEAWRASGRTGAGGLHLWLDQLGHGGAA